MPLIYRFTWFDWQSLQKKTYIENMTHGCRFLAERVSFTRRSNRKLRLIDLRKRSHLLRLLRWCQWNPSTIVSQEFCKVFQQCYFLEGKFMFFQTFFLQCSRLIPTWKYANKNGLTSLNSFKGTKTKEWVSRRILQENKALVRVRI